MTQTDNDGEDITLRCYDVDDALNLQETKLKGIKEGVPFCGAYWDMRGKLEYPIIFTVKVLGKILKSYD